MKLIKYGQPKCGGYEIWQGKEYWGLIITDYGDYTCYIDGHTVASSDKLWIAKIKFLFKYIFYSLYR